MGSSVSSTASYVPFASEDETSFWSKVPLFQRLPTELHPEITACSQKVEFQPGDIIIKQGDEGHDFFVIKKGTARITIDGVMMATVTSGDYFGETALLRGEPRAATIVAATDIEALKITGQQFRQLGLHERLEFPKRDKVLKRHKMLASGAAGLSVRSTEKESLDNAIRSMRSTMAGANVLTRPKTEENSWSGQMGLLKEIFIDDKLHFSAFLLVPIGQFIKHMDYGPGPIFFSNFVAIVPLASILGQATECLSSHTGQVIGGLLNATFGNLVEMIMCIQAVKAGLIEVVQGNLLGSVLSNLLLVLGMAIFAAGTVRKSQTFNAKGAAANMTCQLVASISICLPTCFAAVSESSEHEVLMISRICSVFLMSVYGLFLFFMLKTHAELFMDEGEESEEGVTLSPTLSVIMLAITTFIVFLCSECLVDSIEGVSEKCGLSKCFIGVILLPIVGNAAEHVTAVSSAYKGMMDLALGVAVGSSTQIALFVVPCAVLFGWVFDQPMNLDFTIFDSACQMLTVFLVSQVLAHGETNWLHGAMLVTVYIFIAVQTLFLKLG